MALELPAKRVYVDALSDPGERGACMDEVRAFDVALEPSDAIRLKSPILTPKSYGGAIRPVRHKKSRSNLGIYYR